MENTKRNGLHFGYHVNSENHGKCKGEINYLDLIFLLSKFSIFPLPVLSGCAKRCHGGRLVGLQQGGKGLISIFLSSLNDWELEEGKILLNSP